MLNNLLLNLSILIFVYLIFMVILTQLKHDTSISNFTWGGGVMLVALYTIFILKNFQCRPILITSLLVLWALRLITYLYFRYTGKDPRFENWKLSGLTALLINITWIIFGQLLLLIIMSIPGYLVNTTVRQTQLNIFDIIGLIVWICGFCIESISDYQLFNFLKNSANKGHVMKYGLWKYSRHPNYFGEVIMWWGIFCIAINAPYGLISIIAPISITILLRFITGVPLLENAMKDNPEYQEYKKHTNTFILWFNK